MGRFVVRFMADIDAVGLNVEDEPILGPLFLERLGILDLVAVTWKQSPKTY